ncbi:uncharacterized protein prdm2a [Festucalex cinctus]
MEQTPYFSNYGDGDDLQQEADDICQENTSMDPDTPDVHDHLAHASRCGWESFPCQYCKRCFSSQQGLERHMHSHNLMKNVPHTYKSKKGKIAPDLNFDQLHDNMKPSVSVSADASLESSNMSGHSTVLPDEKVYELHACSYCEKRFSTYTNKQQHEGTVHKQLLQIAHLEQSEPVHGENLQQIIIATSNHGAELAEEVVENEVECAGNYMLDVSSSVSENISFYFDGKIVSASTLSGYEAAEVNAACSTLVGLDALILDPTQLNLGLSIDSILTNQELPGQALAKRRTATPPLLPQIQTELESEVVTSSSSSEVATSLIENLFPQNAESSLVPLNSTTVFLSSPLNQQQEKQDALLPDCQTSCSSESSAAGRFKRRTGSPQSSPQHTTSDEETPLANMEGDASTLKPMDTQYSFLMHQANENGNTSQKIEEPQIIPVLTESWPPVTVDKCCSHQPLDLSNTMKRNEVGTSDDAALDLSLQKRSLEESQLTSNSVSPSEDNLNMYMQERAVLSVGEQNISLTNLETPLVSDLTIVTSSNMVDSVAEGIVYGLSLPSCPLTSAPTTLTPLGFPPASPCTISFAPPTTHPVLSTAPSLITVLAPPLSIPSPSSQPIQVLASNISPEPLVLCTENAINTTQCDLSSAFAATNATNIVTFSHPIDPSLNLPGHMFLTDQISLNPPLNEDHSMSEVPFTPIATLNDPLVNSYNITSNTVLIECTISLETPGNVPAAVTMQDTTEPPVSTQMLVNHIEQQQIVSLPNTATVDDPTLLMSSIEESVTLSSSASVKAEELEQGLEEEPPDADEEKRVDSIDSGAEVIPDYLNLVEKVETQPSSNSPSDKEQQTFTTEPPSNSPRDEEQQTFTTEPPSNSPSNSSRDEEQKTFTTEPPSNTASNSPSGEEQQTFTTEPPSNSPRDEEQQTFTTEPPSNSPSNLSRDEEQQAFTTEPPRNTPSNSPSAEEQQTFTTEPPSNTASNLPRDEEQQTFTTEPPRNSPSNSSRDEEQQTFTTEPPSNTGSDEEQQTFTKNFLCNVCNVLFHSMKELGHHVSDHAEDWPYKCEFCVLLFDKPSALLEHRSSLHGVDKTYVCSACPKDFVYLCNLKQHQEELHPSQQCTFTEEEKGKIRPQNYNYPAKVSREPSLPDVSEEQVKKEENEVDVAAEELFTTIKIMASDGGKLKVPDVRLGINQHYPSFKPPPFPYHNRSPAGSLASATNFTTHNIPQTFSTAIRCTKCGKSFDNMPELHKHILACANASDKKRYTPKNNPIPLRHFAKSQNGVLSTTNSENECNTSNRTRQSNRSTTESSIQVNLKLLNKRKQKLVQRVMPQRSKSLSNKVSPSHVQEDVFVCPHCSREFTMRRSRTKHMAVCPKKPREGRTRKEAGISVTKENDGRLHRGVSHANEQQASVHPKTRLQTSGPAKRPTAPPAPTGFSNKRPKQAIKEDSKNDISTLNEFPMVRTFNPPLRQYTRVHHAVKISPAKQQQSELPTPSREEATAGRSSEQSATA